MHVEQAVAPMTRAAPWLGVLRPRFLLLALSCVALGVALALQGRAADAAFLRDALLALLGALAAHAGVNALNEYSDFRQGLDQQTRRTPFSGGSGTLVAYPQYAGLTLGVGLGCVAICAGIGGYFLYRQPELIVSLAPIGALGLALVLAYTPWLTRRPWLCLLAPGLGFALVVLGTQRVLGGPFDAGAWLVSAVVFFLCNNLLLLNQFPDLDADRAVGRRTLPMLLGCSAAVRVLVIQWALAYAVLALALGLGGPHAGAALGLLGLPLAVRAGWLLRVPHDPARLLPALGLNVAVAVLTPALMALGLLLARLF